MYFIRFVKYVKFAIVIIQRIAIFFSKKEILIGIY